jgi:enoyl-CoA hydratase/carnithine racemase
MSASDPCRITLRRDGAIRVVDLDLPEAEGTLGSELCSQLEDAFQMVARDPDDTKLTVMTGLENISCTGLETNEINEDRKSSDGAQTPAQRLIHVVTEMRQLTVAWVKNGAATDRSDFVFACDLVLSTGIAENGKLEIKSAVSPTPEGKAKLVEQGDLLRELEPDLLRILSEIAGDNPASADVRTIFSW